MDLNTVLMNQIYQAAEIASERTAIFGPVFTVDEGKKIEITEEWLISTTVNVQSSVFS